MSNEKWTAHPEILGFLRDLAEFMDCVSVPDDGGDDWLHRDEDDLLEHIDETGCFKCRAAWLRREFAAEAKAKP